MASRGMSALARTFIVRYGSAQSMNFCSSGSSGDGSNVFSFCPMTRPVVPSSEIQSPALKVRPLTRISRPFSLTSTSLAPATQHLPMPRVTTAAWLVIPPREVRMPTANSMPLMSSGVVSARTKMKFMFVFARRPSLIALSFFVLVVVEDRYVHGLLQGLLNIETFRGLDVFEVDPAEGELQKLAHLNDIVGIVAVDFDIKHIHIREAFKEDGLALHDGLAGEGADVAQSENGGSVSDHGDQISAPRVLK